MNKKDEIIRIFPEHMKSRWEKALLHGEKLQEIRLGAGQPVRLKFAGEERFLTKEGEIDILPEKAWYLTEKEIDEIIKNVCKFSLYAFENEIRQGYITVSGGHRIGMAGQVVLDEKGNIRNMSHIRFLNIRISHEVLGAAKEVMPYVYKDGRVLNTLLVSPPGCGKTTLLRDIIRQLSNGNTYGEGRQVAVVDERSEIAGSFRGTPQNDVGIRTDVLDGCPKVQGMMLLMRSMSPSVVAVDEIGSYEDIKAVYQILQCGSSVIATMHGSTMEDVHRHMYLNDEKGLLFDRFLFLEKKHGVCQVREIIDGRGQKVIWGLERKTCCG